MGIFNRSRRSGRRLSKIKDDIENSVNNSENKKLVSTESGGDSRYPVNPVKNTGNTGYRNTPQNSVDDSEKSQPAEKYLTQETIENSDGRYKVKISVYRIGEEEKIIGDKVVRRAKLKFVISYRDTVKECVDDCTDAIKEIAKMTYYKISKGNISVKIAELREQFSEEVEIPVVDYVRQKYPERFNEILSDPFKWILERTKEIVGFDRLKLLTFLAIVSSQMERVMGMSRVHIMLVGRSGSGKSSTIKSVLKFIDFTNIYIPGTRFTPNALGYLNIDSFDGKILFLEQIDRQIINYLREMMTEDRICTWVTVKVVDESGEHYETRQQCTFGQAVVITTSVADTINVDRDQLFNRFLKVYLNPDTVDTDEVIKAIWTRKKVELSEVDKLVFMAYLFTRPKFAETRELLERAQKFLRPLKEYTRDPINRVAEVLRNLAIAVAIARGKTKVDDDDFEFVMSNFQLDVLYNGLGLTEFDIEIVKLLPESGGLLTTEIADRLRASKQYVLNQLKNLERKGVVEGEKANNKNIHTWYLTDLGRRIKTLINNVDIITTSTTTTTTSAITTPSDNATVDKSATNNSATDKVTKAYQFLKHNGFMTIDEFVEIFGDDVLNALKSKDLVTFSNIDGVEYVRAK